MDHVDGCAGELPAQERGHVGSGLNGGDAKATFDERRGGLAGAWSDLERVERCGETALVEKRDNLIEERGGV